MKSLSQIVAIEPAIKAEYNQHLTQAYQKFSKSPLLNGISRVYTPKKDDDEVFPSEVSIVQLKVPTVLSEVSDRLAKLLNVSLDRDMGNCQAKADVKVDGVVLVKDAPVSYLLMLEKQLVDIHTFVSKLPTVDPTEKWQWDSNDMVFKTEGVETLKTKKIPRNHVKAEATDKHPAQVEVYHEDVPVGTWKTVKFSGSITPSQVEALKAKVSALQQAVKLAREEANQQKVSPNNAGDGIAHYLFGNI